MPGRAPSEPSVSIDDITHLLARDDLDALSAAVSGLSTRAVIDLVERLNTRQRAVVYRLLPKQQALDVFESLQPSLQGELV